jgi:histidinol phosphatase-like PHP family hydrolase
MILDLHSHSIKSDDGRARVDSYCQWIRKRGVPIDGFVLTEHRLLILRASEVETEYGHVLVFGVNPDLRAAFDFGAIDLRLEHVVRSAEKAGAIAVPCHPGRPTVGLCAHYGTRGPVEGVKVIEVMNGGSRAGEDEAAQALAQAHGYAGVGGSDAHLVSQIGRCATRFEREIRDVQTLVRELDGGRFEAVSWR